MFSKLAVSTALALVLAPAAHAEIVDWSATLDQAQEVEVATEVPGATGTATGTFDTISGELTYDVTFDGLSGPATGMHFHAPAAAGEDAGIAFDIGAASGLESGAEGSADLNPAEIAQVQNGMWYVNVHTDANPNGEIRGQVMLAN